MTDIQIPNEAFCATVLALDGQYGYPSRTEQAHYQSQDFQQYPNGVMAMEEYNSQHYQSDNYSDNSTDGSDCLSACDVSYCSPSGMDAFTSSPGCYQTLDSSGEMYSMRNAEPMQETYTYSQSYNETTCYQQQSPVNAFHSTISSGYVDDEDSLEVPLDTRPLMEILEETDVNHRVPNFSSIFPSKPASSKRGRPVTYNKPGHEYRDMQRGISDDDERPVNQSRCKRGAKNILLWKFLLEELGKSQGHIKWEDKLMGTFKFVDTLECSKRWGKMKKKDDMNFEKLSRGIRHYYKDGLMSRKDGIRLVYKFNWDRVPMSYRPRFSYQRGQ